MEKKRKKEKEKKRKKKKKSKDKENNTFKNQFIFCSFPQMVQTFLFPSLIIWSPHPKSNSTSEYKSAISRLSSVVFFLSLKNI